MMREYRRKSDNEQIAAEMLLSSHAITEDRDVLSEIIDTDVRDNLPPQMLAVMAAVFRVIEEIDGREGK